MLLTYYILTHFDFTVTPVCSSALTFNNIIYEENIFVSP